MSKIEIVLTLPATEREKMEEILHDYDLVIGPFGQESEKDLTDFLNSKLPYLRAVSLESNHQIFLYLAPENSGWLIEQINRHSHQGLSKHCLSGLVLDTKDYPGSLPQLWAEASSFGGKRFLLHTKKTDVYCRPFLEQVEQSPWYGIILRSAEENTRGRFHQTIIFLHITRNTFKLQTPIWTELFLAEEERESVLRAGGRGFYTQSESLKR